MPRNTTYIGVFGRFKWPNIFITNNVAYFLYFNTLSYQVSILSFIGSLLWKIYFLYIPAVGK